MWRCGGKTTKTRERKETTERTTESDPRGIKNKKKIKERRRKENSKTEKEGIGQEQTDWHQERKIGASQSLRGSEAPPILCKNVRQGRVEDPGDHGRVRSIPCPAWSVAGRIASGLLVFGSFARSHFVLFVLSVLPCLSSFY